MVEFYLILKAVKPDLGQGMFWRLLIGTVLMLAFGYMGEQSIVNPWAGFAVGMAGWAFILAEIFVVSPVDPKTAGEFVASAFNTMSFIVLNLVYNLADMLNKIWFVLAIWHAAKQDTA